MKYIYKISLILFLFAANDFAQQTEKIIARVGNENITTEEFATRYQLMPHFTDKKEDLDSAKRKFLYSLIAEKLWAKKAQENRLDTSEAFKLSMNSLKSLLLKDELYRKVVLDKIKITNDEVRDGVRKFNYMLDVDLIASIDSSMVWSFYSTLLKTNKFDSLLTANSKLKELHKNSDVTFGDFESARLEDSAFALKRKKFTPPIKTKRGWIIVRLNERKTNPRKDEKPDVKMNIVYNKIRDRKAELHSGEFLDSLLGGLQVNVNFQLFNKLVDAIQTNLKKEYNVNADSTHGDFYFVENLSLKLLKTIETNLLNAAFVQLPGKDRSLKEFIYYLSHQSLKVSQLDKNTITNALHKQARSFIENEMLADRGRKIGLENLPSLKDDLERWQQNYLAQLKMNNVWNATLLSDHELYDYYQRKYKISSAIPQVNILEILSGNLDVIEKVLKEIEKGAGFRELAKKYTEREYTKENGGEFGFFPITDAGEIGKAAAKMKIGEVYGPIKTQEGFSIIKLIGKRNLSDSSSVKFDEVKEAIKAQLRLKKFDEEVQQKTVQLAKEIGVTINEKVFKQTEVTPIKMFAVRYLGFGGKIAALPLTIPLYDWYYKYKNDKPHSGGFPKVLP